LLYQFTTARDIVAEDPKAEHPLAKKGHQCSCKGHEVPNATMNNLVKAVRPELWMKGQHIATGQANMKAYNRKLCELIAGGNAKPSQIISHQLPLEQAPQRYGHFDASGEGWTKVVLKTAA
jgi:threonine dehydrogenase-like Zn-dependent dehydrogenase